jgi:hypothetical protein
MFKSSPNLCRPIIIFSNYTVVVRREIDSIGTSRATSTTSTIKKIISNSKFKTSYDWLALIPQPLLPELGAGEQETPLFFPAPSPKLVRGLGRGQTNVALLHNF